MPPVTVKASFEAAPPELDRGGASYKSVYSKEKNNMGTTTRMASPPAVLVLVPINKFVEPADAFLGKNSDHPNMKLLVADGDWTNSEPYQRGALRTEGDVVLATYMYICDPLNRAILCQYNITMPTEAADGSIRPDIVYRSECKGK